MGDGPRVSAKAGAIVAADSSLLGNLSIGAGTVVHPLAVIDGRDAPVVIGDNCIVEEMVTIKALGDALVIGDGNMFEVGSTIKATAVGNCNQFEARCSVAGIKVRNFCTVGAACTASGADLPDRTVVYGRESLRREWSGHGVTQQLALQAKHLEYLRDMLPTAHKLRVFY